MIKQGIILLSIFLLSNISAACNSEQININSASAEELDALSGIGSVKALAIIEARPFVSVDDLIRVKGIGETTLNNIKSQGLACVNEVENIPENFSETPKETKTNDEEKNITIHNDVEIIYENHENGTENPAPINLSQNIKSEDNKEDLKINLPFYGLVAICVIFGILFLVKNRKRKNEFN